jgi:mono/diheme cytochrome c family protein
MKLSVRTWIAGAGCCVIVMALGACAIAPAPAYDGDPVAGREVARSLCASCHSIEAIGASPNPGAPPLRFVLANYNPDRLVDDLENAVSINHLRMPTFYFGDHHPADLVAYLETIQQSPPPN